MSGCFAHQFPSAAVHSCARPKIRDLVAGIDHRAVQVAGNRRPHPIGDDGHHGLIQQNQTRAHAPLPHHRSALEMQRERQQVDVVELGTNLCCPRGGNLAPGKVARSASQHSVR